MKTTTVIADKETGEVQLELPMFYSPFHHRRVTKKFTIPSKTHQSHAESCDVNRIIDQYARTGQLPPEKIPKQYGDVSNLNKPMGELIADAKDIGEKIAAGKKEVAAKKAAKQKEILDQAAKLVAEKKAADAATPPESSGT